MMAKDYQLTDGGILRARDGANIPVDPGNRDYSDYQDWLAAGNTPDPADPPPAPSAPEETPLTAEDVERLLLALPGMTQAKIDTAKRDRGKPLP